MNNFDVQDSTLNEKYTYASDLFIGQWCEVVLFCTTSMKTFVIDFTCFLVQVNEFVVLWDIHLFWHDWLRFWLLISVYILDYYMTNVNLFNTISI